MMIKVYRYPERISLNGREYLLDDSGKELEFETIESIYTYLETCNLEECGIFTEELTEDSYPIIEQLRIDLKVWNDSQITELYNHIIHRAGLMGIEVMDDGNGPYTEEMTDQYRSMGEKI